ncbi:methionine--tRNA ligase, mitochondrial [Biomphalaria glabrata]|nr:methionine--tRNA ligase, mitochondrial [Biomphalaria glabrata]
MIFKDLLVPKYFCQLLSQHCLGAVSVKCCSCAHRQQKAHVHTLKPQTCFITTPIYYVNAAPHIGHLYCSLLADVLSRWNNFKGIQTFVSTGTDEHGLKIQQAAAAKQMDPLSFSNLISSSFKSLFDASGIRYSRFIRTTEPDHHAAVSAFWNRLHEKGHIYKGSYSGWYSVSDEAFLTDADVEEKTLSDGSVVKISKASGHVVTWTEEQNYLFKLTDLQADLIHWLNTSKPIFPQRFEPAVRNMLQHLPDLSLTRDRSRLPWGIPVPGDDTQTIYVWLDALVNYLTVTGYPNSECSQWPPTYQIIGKDILKFHAVYWPAFLIAAGLEPPPKLVVHSHWLVDNVKMSKSLGNVVDPVDRLNKYGVDGLRYFLLKEGTLDSDCTYSDHRIAERINTDLANTIGNLLGRLTAPSVNKKQEFVALNQDDLYEFLSAEEREKYNEIYNLPDKVDQLFAEFHFNKGIDLIMGHLHWANSLVQSHAPWVLSKSEKPQDVAQLNMILHVAMETLRVCGLLMQPVMPELSDRLLTRLGVPGNERLFSHAKTPALGGYSNLGQKIILQKKIDSV